MKGVRSEPLVCSPLPAGAGRGAKEKSSGTPAGSQWHGRLLSERWDTAEREHCQLHCSSALQACLHTHFGSRLQALPLMPRAHPR